MIRAKTRFFSLCFSALLVCAVKSNRAMADNSANGFSTSNNNQILNYDQQNDQENAELQQELNEDNAAESGNSSSQSQAQSQSLNAPQAQSASSTQQQQTSPTPQQSAPNWWTQNSQESSNSSSPVSAPDQGQEPESEPESESSVQVQPQMQPEANSQSESGFEAVPESQTESQTVTSTGNSNLSYEKKLHDIYEKYYSKKMPSGVWSKIVSSQSTETYQVQKNDNLWNISKTFFGNGFYWPKIWSLNGSITDPHLINPNDTIQFTMGNESNPPSFNVSSQNSSSGSGEESESGANVPEIPSPTNTYRPVVRHLPPSLPEWQNEDLQGDFDTYGIEFVPRKILKVKSQIPLVSYIAESPPKSNGTIAEIETGDQIASSYQYIYVRMKPGVGQIGAQYLAVANEGRVLSADPSIKGFLGYSIRVQGEVQLIEKVRARDPDKGQMYRALVLGIVNPVSVGAELIHGKIQNVSITENGPHSQIVAQIIGGSFFRQQLIYGNDSVAYINRGAEDGVKVGQILPIRANLEVRDPNTPVLQNVRPIGWLRVVKTTPHFATCIVIHAWTQVLTGDLTGSGPLLRRGDDASNSEINGPDFQ